MSGDLKFNKIAGAGLATVFTILIVNTVAGAVYDREAPEKMGYHIEVAEESEGAGAPELPPDWGTVLPAADLAAGERAFARCATCHTITQGGANGTGPNLYGVMGLPIGKHAAGFKYSADLSGKGGNWDFESMNAWLLAPKQFAPGTTMGFAGLKDDNARASIILYLNSLGSNLPLPAPKAADAPAADETQVAAPEGDAEPVDGMTDPTAETVPAAAPAAAPAE